MDKNKEAIIYGALAVILIISATIFIKVVDFDSMLNPPLNAGCETQRECYYQGGAVCKKYNTEAYYAEGICSCYEYDLIGELIVAKNKVM
jgi:hypothetical protein